MFQRREFLGRISSTIAIAAGTAALSTEAMAAKAKKPKPVSGTHNGVSPTTQLNTVFDSLFDQLVAASPINATALGLDKGKFAALKSKLDDRSESGVEAYRNRLNKGVRALSTIKREDLKGMDRISYDTVVWDMKTGLEGAAFPYGEVGGYCAPYVISQLTGVYCQVPDFLDTQHTIETSEDAEAYLSRLSDFAVQMDAETGRFRAGLSAGVTPPDFIIERTLTQMKTLATLTPDGNSLITSVAKRAKEKGIAGDWQGRAQKIVDGPVAASLGRQIALMESLLPKAKHEAGAWRLPQGEALYAWAVKTGTSTGLTADEVHKIGLEKVAEISAEIDTILKSQGLTQGTPGARMTAMGKDPRFLYPNTDAGKEKLLADLRGYVDEVYKKVPDYFHALPKSKLEIRRVPPAIEAGAPGGYYMGASLDGTRPGAYYINLRDTGENPSFGLKTLTFHEGVPGHHFQISLQQEAQGLPMMRKVSGFNAYVEGWALYSEQLADEMGLYENDPFGKVGYLKGALFRAVRLVVDTGMHAKRWSREQAITYMVDVTGTKASGATSEIERYVVWPGQALGYMIGKIQWLKMRELARAKSGAAFNIKAFHDAGLLAGAVPLAVLEQVYKDAGLI